MKMRKMVITAFAVILAASAAAKAEEITVDFDGKIPQRFGVNNLRSVSFSEKFEDIEEPAAPEPVLLKDAAANLDHSILKAIGYCERTGLEQSVGSNLTKLLVLGTKDEKREFMNSAKYVFPQRFAKLEGAQLCKSADLLKNKGSEMHCWEDNCRMEKVCGYKKSCSRGCELAGLACATAGAAITQYYTGGAFPNASAAVGGAAGLGCTWACEDWACEDVEDCHYVKKCDSHCENTPVTDGTDHIDPNTGQILHA